MFRGTRFARIDFAREARWLTVIWVLVPTLPVLLLVVVPWLVRLIHP